jgi:hypothetical protein
MCVQKPPKMDAFQSFSGLVENGFHGEQHAQNGFHGEQHALSPL